MTKTTLMADYGIPDSLGGLVLQARRADWDNIEAKNVLDRPVYVQADFTEDREYIGYSVHVRIGDGHRAFEIRGVMTHFFFVPFSEFVSMPNGENELEAIAKISASCGPFDSYKAAQQSALVLVTRQARYQHLPRWQRDPNLVVRVH